MMMNEIKKIKMIEVNPIQSLKIVTQIMRSDHHIKGKIKKIIM